MRSVIHWIKKFFGFSQRETNGFIILLPLLVLIIFSEPLYRHFNFSDKQDFTKDSARLDSLALFWKKPSIRVYVKNVVEKNPANAVNLFQFNPNTASNSEL